METIAIAIVGRTNDLRPKENDANISQQHRWAFIDAVD